MRKNTHVFCHGAQIIQPKCIDIRCQTDNSNNIFIPEPKSKSTQESLGHRVVPYWNEYNKTNTTIMNFMFKCIQYERKQEKNRKVFKKQQHSINLRQCVSFTWIQL